MNLNYILKLQRNVMDATRELLPYFYALVIRCAIYSKIADHYINFKNKENFVQLVHIVFEEIHGQRMSNLFITNQCQRYILEFREKSGLNTVKLNLKAQKLNMNLNRLDTVVENFSRSKTTKNSKGNVNECKQTLEDGGFE